MQGVGEQRYSLGLRLDGTRNLQGIFNKTVRVPLLTWQTQSKCASTPPFEEFVKTGYLPAETFAIRHNVAPGGGSILNTVIR